MLKSVKNNLPQWYNDTSQKDLILSDDIDSLLSVKLLEQVKPEWNLKYFYDFESGIFCIGEKGEPENAVGVDIAIDKNIKTFDNHVTSDDGKGLNQNSINLNNVNKICSYNYSKKYCCSTALLIYSLFDIPLPDTDLGKAILLAIDSTYISYYNPLEKNRTDWLNIHKHWLCDILGFTELYELERSHKREDFEKFSFINRAKIQVIDDLGDGCYTMYYPLEHKGELEKALDISLNIPNEKFSCITELKAKARQLNGLHKTDFLNQYNIFSFAMTGKNYCNYSVCKKECEQY